MIESPALYIIDDDPSVLDSMRMIGESIGLTVNSYQSANDFLANYSDGLQGCMVLDVRLPNMSGMELLSHLLRQHCSMPAILITGHANVAMSVEAMKIGAYDFIEKPCPPQKLISAIQEALERGRQLLLKESENRKFCKVLAKNLEPEEFAVLVSIAQGLTNAETAKKLDVSLRTIQFRKAAVYNQLGVSSKPEFMELLYSVGWNPNCTEFFPSDGTP